MSKRAGPPRHEHDPNKRPRPMMRPHHGTAAPYQTGYASTSLGVHGHAGAHHHMPGVPPRQSGYRPGPSAHTGSSDASNRPVADKLKEMLTMLEVVWPKSVRATKPACLLWYHLALAATVLPPIKVDAQNLDALPAKIVGNLLRNYWDASIKQQYYYGNFPYDEPSKLQQFVKGKGCFKVFPVNSANPDQSTWAANVDLEVLERWYINRMALAVWPNWRSEKQHFVNYKLAVLLSSDKNTHSTKNTMPVDQLGEKLLVSWSARQHNVPNPAPPFSGTEFMDLLKKLPHCFKLGKSSSLADTLCLQVPELKQLYEHVANNRLSRINVKIHLQNIKFYRRGASSFPGDLRSVPLMLNPCGGSARVVPSADTILLEWDPEDNAESDAKAGLQEGTDGGDQPVTSRAGGTAQDMERDERDANGPVVVDPYLPVPATTWVGNDPSNTLPVVLVSQAGCREWKSMLSHLHACCNGSGTRCSGFQALQDDSQDGVVLAALLLPEESVPLEMYAGEISDGQQPTAPATVYVFPLTGIAAVAPAAVEDLRRLLEDETMMTVVHGSNAWSSCVAAHHRFQLGNLVDLQVFHGWLALLHQLRSYEPGTPHQNLNRAPLFTLVQHYKRTSPFLEQWAPPMISSRSRTWGHWPPSNHILTQAASHVTPLLELYCMIQVEYHKCSTVKALTRADTLLAHLQLAETPPLAHRQPQFEALRATPPTTAAFLAAASSFAVASTPGKPPFVQLDLRFNERYEAVVTLASARRLLQGAKTGEGKDGPAGQAASNRTAATGTQQAVCNGAAAPAAAGEPTAAGGATTAGQNGRPSADERSSGQTGGSNPPRAAPSGCAPPANTPLKGTATPANLKTEPQQEQAPTEQDFLSLDVIDLVDSDDEAPADPTSEAAQQAAQQVTQQAGGQRAGPAAWGPNGAGVYAAGAAAGNGVEEQEVDPDVASILRLLPPRVVAHIPRAWTLKHAEPGIMEVVVDHRRPVQVKLSGGVPFEVLEVEVEIGEAIRHLWSIFTEEHEDARDMTNPTMQEMASRLFQKENRLTFDRSLHRISAMRDGMGGVAGLTFRIGRHVPGVARVLTDILHQMTRNHDEMMGGNLQWGHGSGARSITSLLLVGRPGAGKTTMLRDLAHMLANTFRRNTVVLDTSNEIAGDGRSPHPCIGYARRVSVDKRDQQHSLMLEVVQNHSPQVLMLDELGQSQDVKAAIEISKRGVMMVATAHGGGLKGIMQNPELNPLLGGLSTVTLGDITARERNKGVKTFTERETTPAFGVVVEMLSRTRFRVHPDAAESVDAILSNRTPPSHIRSYDAHGNMSVELDCPAAATSFMPPILAPEPLLPSLQQQIAMLQQSSWLLELLRVNFLARLQETGQLEEDMLEGPGGTFRIGDVSNSAKLA